MLGSSHLSGYDPVARRRHRRLLARCRPLLLPAVVLLSALLLGARLLPGPDPAGAPVAAPVQPPDGRVLVVVTPTDPAVLALATPGAVVDVYGAQDIFLTADLPGSAAPPVGLLVESAPVVGPGGAASGTGPDPPDAGLAVVTGSPAAASVVLAVTDDEARALAGQQGRGLSLAVRSAAPAVRDAGAGQPGRG